jgi:membrane protein
MRVVLRICHANPRRSDSHLTEMTYAGIKRALVKTYDDVLRHHTCQAAAALSYYFVLAIFPALILLSAVMGLFPLPGLFGRVLDLMSRLLPPDTMHLVSSALLSVLASRRGAWVSVGSLGLLWVTSAAFDALIETLDAAYDVNDPRPWWKTRALALALGAISGGFLTTALVVMILGPKFAEWLGHRVYLPRLFVLFWPVLHWVIAIGSTVLTVETLYFLAPNVKQRFLATLPGAVLAVGSWLGLSYLMGIYFRNFANYGRIYGTLAGFIVFMTWFYWTSFALLVGAELNAEIAKESRQGAIPPKDEPSENQGAASEEKHLDRAA